MKALNLDYQRRSPPAHPAVVGMALFALVLLATQLIHLVSVQHEIAKRQTDISRVSMMVPVLDEKKGNANPEELTAAKTILRKFSVPWDDLLDALENVRVEKVSLLSIEPEPGDKKLIITGEADDYLDVLNYVAALDRQKIFRDVYLAHHEVRQGQQRPVVAFTISAGWGAADL
jgi:Tfp pilus assembly protein PilN